MSYKIKSRIWIEIDDKIFLGEGRVKLLQSIDKTQSLSKSAKELKISYKKAWNLIDSLNKLSEKPIVIKSTGGSGGGGTVLTPYGKKIVIAFDEINKGCWKHLDKQTAKLTV